MPRLVLTDAQWVAMEPHCLGKAGDRGRSGTDNRLFVEAMRWKARTSSPWRDLPEMVGTWNVVWRRFDDWCKAGVWERMFEAVSDDSDMEYAMVDATIVPVHRRGHGAKGGLSARRQERRRAVGRRRSLLSPMRWTIWCASKCCPATAMTRSVWRC